MENIEFVFKHLPLGQIECDPDQPRTDLAIKGEQDRLCQSIKRHGIKQPILVTELEPDRYMIMEGHRRYKCAGMLNLETIPCLVYPKLSAAEIELVRFEAQNNRRPWKPLERAESLQRIKEGKRFQSNRELADYLNLSETMVADSLQLKRVKSEYLEMMVQHGLKTAYQKEFIRLKPKLRKIRNLEVAEIIRIIFEKVGSDAITNAKEFRKLGKIFDRATINEAEIYDFLTNAEMGVEELNQRTEQSGVSGVVEGLIRKFTENRQNGIAFTSKEKESFLQLAKLINEAL